MIDEGFTSRQAYLEAKSAFANARAALALSETEKEQAVRARNAASAEMESVIASFRSKASEEHAAVIAELVELERQLVASGDRDARLAIRAPIDGEVKHVAVDGAGDLVRPGAVVAEIVPSDARLLADIRLAPKDIGHVDVGHRAEIAVTTFAPKKYGVLDGSIEHISPDAFVDERTGETYFKARVAIDAASDGPRGLGDLLSAGMEVNVRVTTDTRTLLAYLLKPVVVSLDNAFIER